MAETQEKKPTAPKAPEVKKYRITAKAGPFVNGRPSPGEGAEIELTDEAARYLVLNGEIEDAAAARRAPVKAIEKPADRAAE